MDLDLVNKVKGSKDTFTAWREVEIVLFSKTQKLGFSHVHCVGEPKVPVGKLGKIDYAHPILQNVGIDILFLKKFFFFFF